MANFASLMDNRRKNHEQQDQQQAQAVPEERQHRTNGAQHAQAESVNLTERQQMDQLEQNYRQHNVGSPQATLGEMEDWQKEHAKSQNKGPQEAPDPHAERDWDVSMRKEQARERTQANNKDEMKIEAPRAPDLNNEKVLAEAVTPKAPEHDQMKKRSLSR